MKHFIIIAFALALAACVQEPQTTDEQLDVLRWRITELEDRIADHEQATGDATTELAEGIVDLWNDIGQLAYRLNLIEFGALPDCGCPVPYDDGGGQ